MLVGCFDPTGRMKSTLMMVRHAIDGRLSSVFVGRVEDDCGVNKVLQFCCSSLHSEDFSMQFMINF